MWCGGKLFAVWWGLCVCVVWFVCVFLCVCLKFCVRGCVAFSCVWFFKKIKRVFLCLKPYYVKSSKKFFLFFFVYYVKSSKKFTFVQHQRVKCVHGLRQKEVEENKVNGRN